MAITREHLRDYLLHADEKSLSRFYPRHIVDNLRTKHRPMLELLIDAMMDGEVVLHRPYTTPLALKSC